MFANLPEELGSRRVLRNPQTISPVIRDGSGSPQWWGAWWRRQGTISKGFINSTEIITAATSPSCSIEITCNQVNFLRNHNGAKSQDELLEDAFLLGVDVADMQGQKSEEFLTTCCGTTKRGTCKERLVKPILVHPQQYDLCTLRLVS